MLLTMGTVASSLAHFWCLYSGVAGAMLENKGTKEARQHGSKRPFRKLRLPLLVMFGLTVDLRLPQSIEALYDIKSSIRRIFRKL